MKKLKVAILSLIALFALVGCDQSPACLTRTADESVVDFVNTPVTDSMKLLQADSLEGKKFAGGEGSNIPAESIDHYGYVSLRSATDGDTANFTQEGFVDAGTNLPISIKTRFLGINTPESTAKVEPWGKRASLFTKHKLEAAQAKADEESIEQGRKVYNIVLITDVTVFGERDSSGNRWLAFVWYRNDSASDWRCLNLELVEQAYSPSQLFLNSEVCPYLDSFSKAEENNKECGYRVFGESDPGFDYTEQVYETTLWYVLNHYEDIGISEEGSSGLQLHILAQVVGIQGDSMYLRDVNPDIEQTDEKLASLYCYSGYNSAIASLLNGVSPETKGVGVVVYFYARATIYSDNIQLSDLKATTTGKRAFRVITENNISKYTNYNSMSELQLSTDTVRMNPATITSQEDVGAYKYQWIDTEIELRTVSPSTDDGEQQSAHRNIPVLGAATEEYWVKASNTAPISYTYYAKIAGTEVYCNLRADASLNPQVVPTIFDAKYGSTDFNVQDVIGKTFHVTGYLVSYFEKYQIQLANNYQMYNYIYEVI
ncbi:MAG: thermonuclease family protein [Erysipelotrichaceae bacterium]|jgi:hypothetical protein|nr:thermonuclease family protein [Erysipelotrichaceae bacterium]